MVLSQFASDKNSVPSTHLMKIFLFGRTSSAFCLVPIVQPVKVVERISNLVGVVGTSIKSALREEPAVGVEHAMKSTVSNEREEEAAERDIFTMPPSPDALVIVSNFVFWLMLISVTEACRRATESVESDLN